ncbi:MAG: adenylosuccinate lyase [Bacteroidales bacterium]|nr:adenylosuccinate lyase [Bacteroidales bacterium]MDD2425069.1 adenylosuccinate lyase [Bacteroidales bacterium]MDD3988622.1 adenylosuccinate lyase [Bacteroidales bacterium]
MRNQQLWALSPVDGRYGKQVSELAEYFSEYALIKYRVFSEIEYLIKLTGIPLPGYPPLKDSEKENLRKIYTQFSEADAQEVKDIEDVTNHDVKAVEYFLKRRLESKGLQTYTELVHFGITSQDINNTAVPLSLKDAMERCYKPVLRSLLATLDSMAEQWADIPMLAHTHGQPASPTRVGKEIKVFVKRVEEQVKLLETVPFAAKFGGATGNLNAHVVAYPSIDWNRFAEEFVTEELGLKRSYPTTQIEHYDHLAALFDNLKRINTILEDLCKDIWSYISMEYFKQKINPSEVGSSTMPHKVNPIDFENAEGNLGVANALFCHLSSKLPVSRLQRDLTDSTVLRNIGVPFAHTLISFKSILKGLSKLIINTEVIDRDLESNWPVVAEAIQTILRRERYPNPYEKLKSLTRTNTHPDRDIIKKFIEELDVEERVKKELLAVTPFNYTGI